MAVARGSAGKIYTTSTQSLIAIDPETGSSTKILKGCDMRPRVSPDGRAVAFEREHAIWISDLGEEPTPKRIFELDKSTSGSPPVWSPDGTQIIVSPGTRDEERKGWKAETLRFNVDGSGRTRLEIPAKAPDGFWTQREDRLAALRDAA
jgi:Tol biopolymer transport system component